MMKKLLLVLAAASLVACKAPDKYKPAADAHAHTAGDGHDHDHAHGEPHPLGSAKAGDVTIEATQLGDLDEADQAFELALAEGSPQPKALRLWVGTETAEGSIKALAPSTAGKQEIHVEMPKPLPADAKLWVEAEQENGTSAVASFDLKK